MKLVTFDEGRVGQLDGEDGRRARRPRSTREYFERGGDVAETGDRSAAGRRTAARADRAEEVLPHGRQLHRPPRGAPGRRLVAPGAQGHRVLPERRRDHRPGRRDRLPRGPDQGARLRARAGHRHRQERQVLRARGGRGLHRRLPGLQRHHRPRHPAPRDAVRRLLLLQGDRHVLPDRPVDRHQGRARPTRRRCAMELRVNGEVRQQGNTSQMRDLDPAPGRLPLGAGLQRRRHHHHRHDLRRRCDAAEPVRLLPPARRPDRGRDRGRRHAAQPRRAVERGARHRAVHDRPLLLARRR